MRRGLTRPAKPKRIARDTTTQPLLCSSPIFALGYACDIAFAPTAAHEIPSALVFAPRLENSGPMRHRLPCSLASMLLTLICLGSTLRSDPVVPGNILDPKNAAEAWNVIRLAAKNVETLLDEKRLPEVPVQISYCSPALRTLPRMTTDPEASKKLGALSARAFTSVNAIASSAQKNNPVGAKNALASLRDVLEKMAQYFDPKAVAADIFFCPMHSDFVSEEAKTPCAKCGMSLLTRRIPYSSIYTKPGEPTIRMSVTASAPAEAGKKMDVKVRLEKADKSPVLHADLMVMHTQPIHLLIEDPSLGDYHHEHPAPTKTPGEYEFSFTPKKTAPYRIWADLVPQATGVQELPFADLPSGGKAEPITDTENRFTSAAGGYRFTLSFNDGDHMPTNAGKTRAMGITVTDPKGKPITKLEPVMNAFCHLVGFYDDCRTVLHLHPTGGDIGDPKLRGGPALGFMLFAPKAGFIRLYCQVMIDGKMLFAPFNLNVEP